MKLTASTTTKVANLIKTGWTYREHESRWVDVDNSFYVNIADTKEVTVRYNSWTVWHKKHAWKGLSGSFTFYVPKNTEVFFAGGLLTFVKNKSAWWVEQARGCDVKIVKGYFYKGYHLESSKVKNYEDAVAKIKLKRSKTARELLKQRSLRKIDLRQVWVSVEDSVNGGNCQAGTYNFLHKLNKIFGEIGGIRADELLKIENSIFTQRAIAAAKVRYAHTN